jgi:hypothetical protein
VSTDFRSNTTVAKLRTWGTNIDEVLATIFSGTPGEIVFWHMECSLFDASAWGYFSFSLLLDQRIACF